MAVAEQLGFKPNSDEGRGLLTLKNREFWGMGPAIADVPERLKIAAIDTTPVRAGQGHVPTPPTPARMKGILAKLAITVEKAEADDPEKLRARITRLEGELAAARLIGEGQDDMALTRARDEGDADGAEQGRKEGWIDGAASAMTAAGEVAKDILQDLQGDLNSAIGRLDSALIAKQPTYRGVPVSAFSMERPAAREIPGDRVIPKSITTRVQTSRIAADTGLPGPQQRILDSLVTWLSLGHNQPSNAQVAWLANYSPTSTSYTNPRSTLKTAELIAYPAPDCLSVTPEGRKLGQRIAITGSLLDFVLAQLKGPEARILQAAARFYPRAASNKDVAQAANYSATSTSYTNPRSALRTKDLITYPAPDQVRAAEWLFSRSK